MKTLLLKLLLFVGGIFSFIVILSFIPFDAFTFRNWESQLWKSRKRLLRPTIGYFYPSQTITRNESGDLGRGSEYEIIKNNILWKTDKYGFRNDSSQATEYQVVLVGDSNSVGLGTSQEFILSTQIGNRLNYKVFNYSPMAIDKYFIKNLNNMNIKPKTVIYRVIERKIPEIHSDSLYNGNGFKDIIKDKLNMVKYGINKIFNFDTLLYIAMAVDRFNKKEPARYLESRIDSIYRKLRISVIVGHDNELFYKGSLKINSATIDDSDIKKIAIELKHINDSLLKLGIDFIFLPVPDKESVYYELLPEETKNNFRNRYYLTKLHNELTLLGVRSIDVYSIFRSRFLAGERLYYSDDTHWNNAGIELASELISEEINHNMGR
ncbi:MAG: hypothetical protein WC899_01050 [bacterium]|jgi:hypothetical protein